MQDRSVAVWRVVAIRCDGAVQADARGRWQAPECASLRNPG